MDYYLRALIPIGIFVAYLVYRNFRPTPTQAKWTDQQREQIDNNKTNFELSRIQSEESTAVQKEIARQLDRIATALEAHTK